MGARCGEGVSREVTPPEGAVPLLHSAGFWGIMRVVSAGAQDRLSAGKARELAGLTLWQCRQLLASRRIPPHYGEADLDEDVATLRELGRL